jgi:hypothetical protein
MNIIPFVIVFFDDGVRGVRQTLAQRPAAVNGLGYMVFMVFIYACIRTTRLELRGSS